MLILRVVNKTVPPFTLYHESLNTTNEELFRKLQHDGSHEHFESINLQVDVGGFKVTDYDGAVCSAF